MKSTDGPRNQNIETPLELIAAVEKRFGPIGWDLAASRHTSKAPIALAGGSDRFFGPGSNQSEDALDEDLEWWRCLEPGYVGWDNGPWKKNAQFAKKCAETAPLLAPGALLAYHGPAAVCTEYFRKYIAPFAYVLELVERPYKTEARDCIVAIYSRAMFTGRESWSWKP